MSRYAYPNPGEAEAVLKQALALLDLFQGVADPAAELARLRGIEKAYAAAVEEIKAWRACPPDHFSKVWSQPQMSGKHRSEFRQAIIEAADAHDTARAEAGMENL